MRFLNLFLAIILFLGAVFSPAVMAQSTLLPEKSINSSDNTNTSAPSSSNSTSAHEEKGEKTLAWALSIVGIMLFALFMLFLEIAIIPGFGIAGVLE